MPQPRSNLDFVTHDGNRVMASVSGNNAAWHCVCDERPLLLGHTCSQDKGDNDRVDCPLCGRQYFIIGEGARYSKVVKIEEVVRK